MTSHRQPDGAPPGWQEAFLVQLRETGNVSAAARAAGTCRSRCYEWRRRDRAFADAWADALEEAADRLEMEAFRRAFPYLDTAGRLTIGVGRNLTDRGLAGDEIDYLLATDIALARSICGDQFGAAFAGASKARRHALVSMAFNLGGPRLAGFTRLRGAVR